MGAVEKSPPTFAERTERTKRSNKKEAGTRHCKQSKLEPVSPLGFVRPLI